MGDKYLSIVNSGTFYVIVSVVLTFITLMCVLFLFKSYRAGIKIGMEKAVLKKTIISSATFTLLPSISILLGVIALSGSLGVPFSWLRLSVIGALQYELQVAEVAAQSMGLIGLKPEMMSMEAFVTIALVMTIGILGGVVCCLLFLKKYLAKLQKTPKKESTGKPGFGTHATTAMFVGLCGAYIGAYVGEIVTGRPIDGEFVRDFMPITVAAIAAAAMGIFEFFIQKKNKKVLENFSLAASMLLAMAAAVVIKLL